MKSLLTNKKALIMASVLTASLSTGYALAGGHKDGDCERGYKSGMMKHHGDFGGRMGHQDMMAREFTADQVRTLTEARLIMEGNPNIKVGKVTSTKTGYTVTIVTQDNSLVEEKEVAKNGMPLKMYEKMQERMKQREEMKKDQ
ncbi:hypothetical protein G8770_06175 [Aestuariicella hydrocarbonica]|uniref:PepSY domain-containing protein n=1 Tax=Pseudomaricurvus hydrocarbonicus TaxID=1470433 RepID=A0A9E5JV41_9GAMM|nr:hypothetical protein [Aestuariicella hydrocarbonica]NHO65126.1 hypothetical protein [Aestuariicella hydrocarbonica]